MNADQRIESLGITLPPESGVAESYSTAVRSGNLLFLSAKAPLPVNGKMPKGRLGGEFSTDQGYALARSVIGVHSLRNGIPLTIKATIEVKPD